MRLKLFENFMNESFQITSEKDENYEKTDLEVEVWEGNTGFMGTAKGTYGTKPVDAKLYYGFDEGAQFLEVMDDGLDEESIEQLTDIIGNDSNFIKETTI